MINLHSLRKSASKIQDTFKSLPASYQADIRWQRYQPKAINEKVCFHKQRHKPLHISSNFSLENAARSNAATPDQYVAWEEETSSINPGTSLELPKQRAVAFGFFFISFYFLREQKRKRNLKLLKLL